MSITTQYGDNQYYSWGNEDSDVAATLTSQYQDLTKKASPEKRADLRQYVPPIFEKKIKELGKEARKAQSSRRFSIKLPNLGLSSFFSSLWKSSPPTTPKTDTSIDHSSKKIDELRQADNCILDCLTNDAAGDDMGWNVEQHQKSLKAQTKLKRSQKAQRKSTKTRSTVKKIRHLSITSKIKKWMADHGIISWHRRTL